MPGLTRMGVLAHPLRPQTGPIASYIAESLRAHGITAWLHTSWQEEDVAADVEGSDMVVAIGGDGAMLRAARVCARYDVPVLGVNMGQLGFLTEINDPDNWDSTLERLLNKGYWIEQRMMIHAAVMRSGEALMHGDALNEVVISGSAIGHMIHLEAYIDDDWTTTYRADALVIATATGSTAYALACGGPILPPVLRNILIVPAAAHLSMDRPIVLAEGATVELFASPESRGDLMVTVDGVVLCRLGESDRVRIQASDCTSRFVRLRERNYFYRSLLDRLEPRVSRSEPTDPKS